MKNICEGKPVSLSAVQEKIVLSLKEYSMARTKVLEVLDKLACKVAQKHAEAHCFPMGINFLDFFYPIAEKDFLVAKVAVNRSWDHYMEIGVKLVAEDFRTLEQKNILSAYFQYMAVDPSYHPIQVPFVIPETEEEKKRYKQAEMRRQVRFMSKRSKKSISPHIFYTNSQ